MSERRMELDTESQVISAPRKLQDIQMVLRYRRHYNRPSKRARCEYLGGTGACEVWLHMDTRITVTGSRCLRDFFSPAPDGHKHTNISFRPFTDACPMFANGETYVFRAPKMAHYLIQGALLMTSVSHR